MGEKGTLPFLPAILATPQPHRDFVANPQGQMDLPPELRVYRIALLRIQQGFGFCRQTPLCKLFASCSLIMTAYLHYSFLKALKA